MTAGNVATDESEKDFVEGKTKLINLIIFGAKN